MEQTLLSIVTHFSRSEEDSPEIRLQKGLLAGAGGLIVLATALWGSIYLVYHEPIAALASILSSLIIVICLLYTYRTGKYRGVLIILEVIGLGIPLFHTIVLGGIWNSGIVIIWSLIPTIGALLVYDLQQAKWWGVGYLGLILGCILLQPVIEHPNHLPPEVVRLFFFLNIGGVSSIILALLGYFVRQKDLAYHMLGLEQAKSESLLLNILPGEIARRLKDGRQTIADYYESASILFADMVGFTRLTGELTPTAMVELINAIYSRFDSLVEKYGVEKIRTIGDNYMIASGLPTRRADHATHLAHLALEMMASLQDLPQVTALPLAFRIGINAGPVIAGVVGHKKFQYDVWGDAVNLASRMESQGQAGKIQVTQAFYDLIKDDFICEPRGKTSIKGKGDLDTWFLVGPIKK